jgi:hypothetical protein
MAAAKMGFDRAHARSMRGLQRYRVLQAEEAPTHSPVAQPRRALGETLFRFFYQNLGAGDTE